MSDPLWPHEVPNSQIRAHARQIADAALCLYSSLGAVNCVPSVLLESALAIELYLKSLNARTVHHPLEGMAGHLLTAEAAISTHRLLRLFDALDEPLRDGLEQAYAKTPGVHGVRLLRDALAQYDNLFVEIRYIFECQDPMGHRITDLVALLRFVKQEVDGMPVRFRAADS